MPAYVISELELLDAEQLAAYRALAGPAVTKYGGRYLARGGQIETIEDDWNGPQRQIVIIEFASLQRAHEWYDSPEYAAALAIRPRASRRRLTFLDGIALTPPV